MHIFQTDTGGEIEQQKQLTKKKKKPKTKKRQIGDSEEHKTGGQITSIL